MYQINLRKLKCLCNYT